MVLEADRYEDACGCVLCGDTSDCGFCVQGDCAGRKVVYCATHIDMHDGHSLFGGEEVCADCDISYAAENSLVCFNCGKSFCCEQLGSKVDGGVRAVCMFCLRAIARRK